MLDPVHHGIRFRRNFGKAAALSAGFRAAKGEIEIEGIGVLKTPFKALSEKPPTQ